MIASIQGKIKFIKNNWLIIEAGGVGYQVFLPQQKHKIGESADFFIHHHIREDSSDLYGFKTYEELEMFEMLLSVSGVGPKMALAILANNSPEKIKNAIIKNDFDIFSATSGVGKKIASKIIVELKNKVTNLDNLDLNQFDQDKSDLVLALESLGFKRNEIQANLKKIPDHLGNLDEQIKWFLRYQQGSN